MYGNKKSAVEIACACLDSGWMFSIVLETKLALFRWLLRPRLAEEFLLK
jgi:hypothetical protein